MHRVCVIDPAASKISNIITQSAITSLLAAHQADFSGLTDLTLQELEMVGSTTAPVTVNASQSYWDALLLIANNVCFTLFFPFTLMYGV